MKKNAFEDSTIKKTAKILRHLLRNCNTADPEEVKLYVAKKQYSNARKENLIEAYDKHIKSNGLQWDKPFYPETKTLTEVRKTTNEKMGNRLL